MNGNVRRTVIGWLVTTALGALLYGQTTTIPQRLKEAGASITGKTGVPSGPPPVFSKILSEADVIVRGFVGNPTSYLSADQREVLTDFPVTLSDFLYRRPNDKAQLKATLTVTLVGGTVKIGAFSYTSRHDALPLLEPQSECLFILKIVNGKHHIAGTYYGAFDIGEGKLKPLTKKQGFAAEYENASASEAPADMVGRLRAMRREADPLR